MKLRYFTQCSIFWDGFLSPKVQQLDFYQQRVNSAEVNAEQLERIFRNWDIPQKSLLKQPFADVLQNRCCKPRACNFIKKRLQHWHFPLKFFEIFKNIFFYRKPPVAASLPKMFSCKYKRPVGYLNWRFCSKAQYTWCNFSIFHSESFVFFFISN